MFPRASQFIPFFWPKVVTFTAYKGELKGRNSILLIWECQMFPNYMPTQLMDQSNWLPCTQKNKKQIKIKLWVHPPSQLIIIELGTGCQCLGKTKEG
jgi:hypothetical protein